jgi:hypothetical protein
MLWGVMPALAPWRGGAGRKMRTVPGDVNAEPAARRVV